MTKQSNTGVVPPCPAVDGQIKMNSKAFLKISLFHIILFGYFLILLVFRLHITVSNFVFVWIACVYTHVICVCLHVCVSQAHSLFTLFYSSLLYLRVSFLKRVIVGRVERWGGSGRR